MRRMLWNGKVLVILSVLLGLFMAVGVAEEDGTEDKILFYGSYAYSLKAGQATIVGRSGGVSGEGEFPDRSGMADEAASIPESDGNITDLWVAIPDKLDGYPVVAIGEGAFFESFFNDVVIPDGITSIGDDAFGACYYLHAVTIPDSVTMIGENAFEGCYNVKLRVSERSYAVKYAQENGIDYTFDAEYKVYSSGDYLYTVSDGTAMVYGYSGDTIDDLTIPDCLGGYLVTAIGGSAFPYSFDWMANPANATLPESLVFIADDAFEGCDEITLTVTEGSYAEQYARENGIPYTFAQALHKEPDDSISIAVSPTGTADELLIRQIDEFFTLPKAEIIEKLGPDYTVVPAGPEGVCDGYYYEDLGMAFAFYPDSDTLELIDCYSNFKINGVGTGSLFSEIMGALGDTEIVETWLELPIYTVFMVRYRLGNSDYSFVAFEEDGPVHILRIHQML